VQPKKTIKDATVKKANAKKNTVNALVLELLVEITVDAKIVQIIPATVTASTVAIAY